MPLNPHSANLARYAEKIVVAAECLKRGNLAAADILCRDAIDTNGHAAEPWLLLGKIAVELRLFEKAQRYFSEARSRGLEHAGLSTAAAMQHPSHSREPKNQRFILLSAWGAGFWSDVSHILGGLVLAEITGRTPIVYWGDASRYAIPGRDAWRCYFEPIPPDTEPPNLTALSRPESPSTGHGPSYISRDDDLIAPECFLSVAEIAPWIPESHVLAGLSVEDILRYAAQKYLRPQHDIISQARSFFDRHLAGQRYVAVHVRGTDKAAEFVPRVSTEEFISIVTRRAFEIVDELDPRFNIFLLTEDRRIKAAAEHRYPGRVITTPALRMDGEIAPHFSNSDDRHRLGTEVMIDVLLALRADAFVGFGGSNVSAMISLLRNWAAGHCALIGPVLLFRRSAFLYLPEELRHLAIA